MGERGKWVPVAGARLVRLDHTIEALHAVVRMVEGEVVTMMFVSSSSPGAIVAAVRCAFHPTQNNDE